MDLLSLLMEPGFWEAGFVAIKPVAGGFVPDAAADDCGEAETETCRSCGVLGRGPGQPVRFMVKPGLAPAGFCADVFGVSEDCMIAAGEALRIGGGIGVTRGTLLKSPAALVFKPC